MKKPKFKSYRRLNGHDEFVEFYQKLPDKDQKKLVSLIQVIEDKGLLVAARMEWIKKLDNNFYEIRSKVTSNIQRCLYFHDDGEKYIITHGFTKKTQKTPARELKHAKEIRSEFYQREEDENNDK